MNRAPVFIQARMTSTRLPGKALLPVAGLSLIVLAARRAANRGHPVTVLTSVDPSDDRLVETLEREAIACHRGSLSDVLGRFSAAVAGLSPDQPIFRLTGDNPVPDGALLEEMEQAFRSAGMGYLASNGMGSGLPYGVSAEIFRAGDVMAAAADPQTTSFDREHVTPWIVRRFGSQIYAAHAARAQEHLRMTVDTLEDYRRICGVFDLATHPLSIDYRALCDIASGFTAPPKSAPAFVLGSAQLGMNYGIANKTGRPSHDSAHWILENAAANQVATIDTAQAYGDSEKVIGEYLKASPGSHIEVITKLRPLTDDQRRDREATLRDIDIALADSRQTLGQVPAILFHRLADGGIWDAAVLKRLQDYLDRGEIRAVGVSIQSPAELIEVLAEPRYSIIQMPFNLLDWRWDEALLRLERSRQERAITVHVRSAFLQGLLLSDDQTLWAKANYPLTDRGGWIDDLTRKLGRRDRLDLCLAYVRAHSFADGIVVGCEAPDQLARNLVAFDRPPLSQSQVEEVRAQRPHVDETVLDPARWS